MSKANSVIALLLCVLVGELAWSYAQSQNNATLTGQDYADIPQLYAKVGIEKSSGMTPRRTGSLRACPNASRPESP